MEQYDKTLDVESSCTNQPQPRPTLYVISCYHLLYYVSPCARDMCNVCCFDACMCLHVADSTTQELQELSHNIFSLLLFVLQCCGLLTVGIALL